MYLIQTTQNYLFDFNIILVVQFCNLLTLNKYKKWLNILLFLLQTMMV